jgi:VanZ family protein
LLLTIIWTLAVIVASNIPASNIPSILPKNSDIFIHFIWYAVMSFGWILSLKNKFSNRIGASLLITVSIGLLNEFSQGMLSLGRSFELSDILSNTFGSLLGTIPFLKKRR